MNDEIQEAEVVSIVPVTQVEAVTRAEIDRQIETAKRYPRSITRFLAKSKEIIGSSPEIASACTYAVPRAGKTLVGPSVRLAEIIIHSWGNLRVYSQVTDIGQDFITVRGVVHDLETNNAVSEELRIPIRTKDNKRYSNDMIATVTNAGASKALRNAVFRIVPRPFVDQLHQHAQKTATGDMATFPEMRDKWIARVTTELGITKDRVFAGLRVAGLEDVDTTLLKNLIALFNSVSQGEMDAEDAFPDPRKEMKRGDQVLNALTAPQITLPLQTMENPKKDTLPQDPKLQQKPKDRKTDASAL